MKRTDLLKRVAKAARLKGVRFTTAEGGSHTLLYFDGTLVAPVPRHKEINELTAKGILGTVEKWSKQ